MENKLLHRNVLIAFIVLLLISTIGLIFTVNSEIEDAFAGPLVLLFFSILLLISSAAIRYNDVIWLRKSAKWSVYLLLVFPIGIMIYGFIYGTTVFFWMLIIVASFLTIFAMIHLFIYSDSSFLTAMVVFMLILVVSIYFKRNRWPLAGALMTNATCFISIGSFMYGIKCLFIAGKMPYFRYTTFLGSLIISFAYLGQLFKIQHWPLGGYFTFLGFGGLIFGTLYLLVTLHSSGYIDWDSFYRKKFRQILIPWTFIFIMYISRYMVPELNTLIWTPENNKNANYGFNLKDYSVEEKNGIKNE